MEEKTLSLYSKRMMFEKMLKLTSAFFYAALFEFHFIHLKPNSNCKLR